MNGFHEDLPQEFFALFHSVKSPLRQYTVWAGRVRNCIMEAAGDAVRCFNFSILCVRSSRKGFQTFDQWFQIRGSIIIGGDLIQGQP